MKIISIALGFGYAVILVYMFVCITMHGGIMCSGAMPPSLFISIFTVVPKIQVTDLLLETSMKKNWVSCLPKTKYMYCT